MYENILSENQKQLIPAKDIFQELFSPKLFKQQLCYFSDIDYTEEVTCCITPVSEMEFKNFLTLLITAVL